MTFLLCCYPGCSTCKKAMQWLDENKIKYSSRNIKTENPTLEELQNWIKISGLPVQKFFNTSGLVYKELNLKEKLPEMPEQEKLRLLSQNGMLVKRPLLVGEKTVLVGFRPEEWSRTVK